MHFPNLLCLLSGLLGTRRRSASSLSVSPFTHREPALQSPRFQAGCRLITGRVGSQCSYAARAVAAEPHGAIPGACPGHRGVDAPHVTALPGSGPPRAGIPALFHLKSKPGKVRDAFRRGEARSAGSAAGRRGLALLLGGRDCRWRTGPSRPELHVLVRTDSFSAEMQKGEPPLTSRFLGKSPTCAFPGSTAGKHPACSATRTEIRSRHLRGR